MKIAVIGNGNVGMAAFGELLRMPEIRELALVGRNVERIRAEVDDYADAQVLHAAPGVKLSGGATKRQQGRISFFMPQERRRSRDRRGWTWRRKTCASRGRFSVRSIVTTGTALLSA